MASRGIGLSLVINAILFSVSFLRPAYADLQIAPVDSPESIPLSPLDFKYDLNNDGTEKIGLKLEKNVDVVGEDSQSNETLARRQTTSPYYTRGSGGSYWYSQITRQGRPAYGTNSTYKVFRNVRNYGAQGDGITDDTDAFNAAIADGFRCGFWGTPENTSDPRNCDSSSTTPAIVYVPPGIYMISRPVVMWYYTHVIGDANDMPILKATADFYGIGVLDADPYIVYQQQWYQNQNNFWRNVRNIVIDTTNVPITYEMHGIHWQVSQAASLENIVIVMPVATPGDGNKHVGIFMDNGSSLFMEDIIIVGGFHGFFAGNQQFNIRNMTFHACQTGILQNWGWVWSYKSISFYDCRVGIDMTTGDETPSVGSLVLADSEFHNCDYGILTSFSSDSTPTSSATLVLDNCLFDSTDPAIAYPNNTVIVAGNKRIQSYIQGKTYAAYDAQQDYDDSKECYNPKVNVSRIQQEVRPPPKSPSLLDASGKFVERSKPQYEGVPLSKFKSIITDGGCSNDGKTDVTACVQDFFNTVATAGNIAFIDHGAYVITDTITIPNTLKAVGEIWPMFMVTGTKFKDQSNPRVAFRVGQPGDIGTVELSEILFETIGPTPGAIMMEWNLAAATKGGAGMWDVHWRIGGTNGTQLQNYNCKQNAERSHGANPACWAAFLLVHLTRTAKNVILSHNWLWVADHELDLPNKDNIDIYNGRGMLIESEGPLWLYGSGSEHSQLYNYQFSGASNIYAGLLQSETAYMQPNPNALSSFTAQPAAPWHDPTFSDCFTTNCAKTAAVRIFQSTYIYAYAAGLYSFFQNYDSACIKTDNCDQDRVYIDQSEGIYMYGLSSIAAENMVKVDGVALVPGADNYATFCNTVGLFEYA